MKFDRGANTRASCELEERLSEYFFQYTKQDIIDSLVHARRYDSRGSWIILANRREFDQQQTRKMKVYPTRIRVCSPEFDAGDDDDVEDGSGGDNNNKHRSRHICSTCST